jgi:hypothetical protein
MFFVTYNCGYEIKEDEMREACRMRNAYTVLAWKPDGKLPLEWL